MGNYRLTALASRQAALEPIRGPGAAYALPDTGLLNRPRGSPLLGRWVLRRTGPVPPIGIYALSEKGCSAHFDLEKGTRRKVCQGISPGSDETLLRGAPGLEPRFVRERQDLSNNVARSCRSKDRKLRWDPAVSLKGDPRCRGGGE